MRFASRFAGSRLRHYPLVGTANASAFLGERGGERLLAVINKSATQLGAPAAALRELGPKRSALLLHAPALDDRTGTVLEPWPEVETEQFAMPPFSAALIRAR